ncbi:MAG: hypothetical protein JNM27_16040 [Leptospirales bacterium]|nr:hypothetical protein [Leptospirales bacterium]
MNVASQALDTLSREVLRGTAWWSGCITALQFTGAVLEYWRNEPLLLWLDIASGAMSAAAVLVCISPFPIKRKRNLTIILMALTVLFEVETAFHDPDYPFHDSRQYLIVIVSMLFLAMVFPGAPIAFTASCLAFIGFYLFRTALTETQFPGPHTGIVFVLQLLFSVVVCSGIQFWIFRLRYTNIVQADELRIAQTKLGRQMMLRDIHDHLGAKLADFANLVARIRTDRSDQMFEALESAAAEAAILLRRGLLAERDREMLAEDFGSAIRVIFFGRYEAAGRQIIIRFKDNQAEDYLRSIDPGIRDDLLAIILEITTNDLKYGHATSVLDFRLKGSYLQMRFLAKTSQSKSRGMGNESLQKRAQAHAGGVSTKIARGRILIRIYLAREKAE